MDTRDNIKSPPCKTRTTNGSVANEIDESERVDDSKDKGHKDDGYEAMKLLYETSDVFHAGCCCVRSASVLYMTVCNSMVCPCAVSAQQEAAKRATFEIESRLKHD